MELTKSFILDNKTYNVTAASPNNKQFNYAINPNSLNYDDLGWLIDNIDGKPYTEFPIKVAIVAVSEVLSFLFGDATKDGDT